MALDELEQNLDPFCRSDARVVFFVRPFRVREIREDFQRLVHSLKYTTKAVDGPVQREEQPRLHCT